MRQESLFYQKENSAPDEIIDRRYYTDFAFTKHIHAKPELVYVTEGKLEATVDGETFLVSQGQFALVLPWQTHAYHTPDHSQCVVLVTAARFMEAFLQKMVGFCACPPVFTADPAIERLFLDYLYEGCFPDEWLISGVLLSLCHCFISQCPLLPRSDPQNAPMLLNAMNYIAARYHMPLSLDDVAKALGYSYHHLSHMFREYAGMSFCQFVNTLRVTRAQQLLRQSDASITSIAFDCGFGSVRSFNRAFIDITGTTPGACRCAC